MISESPDFLTTGDLTGLAFFAAVHAPGRILHPVEHRLQVAATENLITLATIKVLRLRPA
jgi:hypothetical protein